MTRRARRPPRPSDEAPTVSPEALCVMFGIPKGDWYALSRELGSRLFMLAARRPKGGGRHRDGWPPLRVAQLRIDIDAVLDEMAAHGEPRSISRAARILVNRKEWAVSSPKGTLEARAEVLRRRYSTADPYLVQLLRLRDDASATNKTAQHKGNKPKEK